MPIELRRLHALRLAWGVALCLAGSFGLGLPVPILAPVFAVLLLAMRSERGRRCRSRRRRHWRSWYYSVAAAAFC